MTLNAINLVGRVGQDPEVKYFESGSVLCKLTQNKETDWFDIEIWGKPAEIAANYVRKGSQIGVQGSLRMDSWNDRTTGVSRSKPIIRVDRLDLLGSKRDSEGGGYNEMEM
jgi:single-strand DNA-binding protein